MLSLQNSWNDAAIQIVKEKGFESTFMDKYSASKALAERAALEFVEEKKPKFDIVRVLPSGVSIGIRYYTQLSCSSCLMHRYLG